MKNDTQSNPSIPNILIVDDVPANLNVLGNILEEEGYKVRPVLSGLMALQVSEKEKPDLILLDIMMPDMDGFEVCRMIKENNNLNDVPIIFISALNDSNDIVKALTSGGADYITKPFRAEEVKARVATHLKIYQQRKVLQEQSFELREQSEELRELNASKDKFFSIIAHDLRGPFNGFLGLTQIMAEDLPNLTMIEIQEIAVNMRDSAANLFRLLENLLQWARIQRGLIPFDPEVLEALPIVRESLEMLYQSAKRKGIEIEVNVPVCLTFFADRNLLQTVIRNLVSNAIKFTNKGGKINISAKVTNDKNVEIAIKDTGIGMSPELVEQLFRIDVQTGRKGTDDELSTGLGLLLCKEFVERSGGKIWVKSIPENESSENGSTFYFTVPLEKW